MNRNRKLAFVALGISLIGHAAISPCFAVSLSSKKTTALQYEVYSKLSNGAGPQTNDLQKQEAQLDSSTPAPTSAAKTVDLSPVTLDEGPKSNDLGPAEEGVLKATVKREQAVSVSGPVEQAEILKPKSIKQSAGEKALSRKIDAAEISRQVGPIPLQKSEDEEANEQNVKFNTEKLELADLWDSTLQRSQDIQFVMQKLMPSNNSGKTANVMMKMLSATVFGGMSMMTMMAPNMGAQMGANMGASMMMQALNGVQGANDKKARLSQTEAIILYKMVRDTADKLVVAFRDYKIELKDLERTNDQLSKLQEMVKEVRASQTPVEQIKLQAVLMEKQSDIEKKTEHVSRCRQALVDLSGTDAVAKLDKQLEIDRQKIEESSVIAAPQQKSDADGKATAAADGTVPN